MTKQVLCLLCVGLMQATTKPAFADTLGQQIDALMGGYEYVPPASAWTRLGPEAASRLRVIAEDTHQLPSKRLRAVSALALFPTSETRAFLEQILANEQASSLMRRKAALSLAAGFGTSALPVVARHAASPDVRLRDDVARALGLIKTPEARAVLQSRLAVEKTHVRHTIARQLSGVR